MHIPERMCIACRQMKPKSELLRIVKNDDAVELDVLNKKHGRGAYICKDKACIENAKKRHSISRSFKIQAASSIYDEISEACNIE